MLWGQAGSLAVPAGGCSLCSEGAGISPSLSHLRDKRSRKHPDLCAAHCQAPGYSGWEINSPWAGVCAPPPLFPQTRALPSKLPSGIWGPVLPVHL